MTITTDSSTRFDELYTKRARLIDDFQALVDEAGDREYTAAQQERAEKINAEVDRLDREIKRGIADRKNEQRNRFLEDLTGTGTGDSPKTRDVLSRSLGELLGVGARGEQSRSIELSEEAIYEKRDLLTTTTGASVMVDFSMQLESVRSQASPIWSRARTMPTTHTRDVKVPALSAHGSAAFISEGGEIGESDPTLTTYTLQAWKVGQAMQISPESEHEVAGVLDIVAKDMLTNVAVAADVQLHGGDGTQEPQGLIVGFTGSSTATGQAIPTADDLIDAVYDIPAHYRQTGRYFWVFNDSTWAGIRKLKYEDGTAATNQYLWQPGLTSGAPDMLLGYPVYTDSNFAGVGDAAKIGAFYDADRFIVRSTPIRLERSVDYAWLNDLVTYRCVQHLDSQVLDVAAGTIITNEAE